MKTYSIASYIWKNIPEDIRIHIPHTFKVLPNETLIEYNMKSELKPIFDWVEEHYHKTEDTKILNKLAVHDNSEEE